MRIFLAGGVSGNLKPLWGDVADGKDLSEAMNGFLLDVNQDQNLYLAESGSIWNAYMKDEDFIGVKILESFFYISKDPRMTSLIPYFSDFLLDSGAFTFMMGNHKGEIDWQEYTEKYAAFINTNKINKFFELDIDSIVGYEKVKELRKLLESLTGKQPIPVWHKSRGKDEFLRMAEDYKYVALGGIVSKEWSKDEHKFFPWFINEAHKRNAKIHGLGYTNLEGLKKYHFDSVDSTTWTAGNRFGYIYKFDGSTIKKYDAPQGHRLADSRKAALINFGEWVKFQNYAEVHL